MNTLFISPNSPFESIGGVERYIINLINYSKIQPDDKTFLILPTREKSHTAIEKNMTIFYENGLWLPRHSSRSHKDLAEKVQSFSNLVEEIIRKHRIDIICAENIIFGPPAVYSLRLNMIAALHKVPLVLRLHMYPASELQIELTNQLMWEKVSCVSKSVAGDCFQKGTAIDKLSTDYLGVNIDDFNTKSDNEYNLRENLKLKQDAKIILTASRILRGTKNILQEKGIINLIQAFSRLLPRFPKAHLLIGVGRASEDLKDEFDKAYEMLQGYLKLHLVDHASTVKIFELDQMPNVYRQSDVFALTAEKNETFGQTFIEAMACGLTVIGANTGGIPEIISDSYNGFLVQQDDSSILAQKIEKLLKDSSIRKRFIDGGLKTVEEKFSTKKQFKDFFNMLKETSHSVLQEELQVSANNQALDSEDITNGFVLPILDIDIIPSSSKLKTSIS